MSLNNNDYFSAEHLSHGLKSKALKGAAVSIISQTSIFCIQTIGTIIMARLLIPDDFGLVAMILTISLLIGNVGENGFPEVIIQTKELNQTKVSTLFWINVFISIVLAFIFIASSSVIIWFYKEDRLKFIVFAMAGANMISSLSVFPMALLKRNIQFKRISANYLQASIISNSIPIFLAWWGFGYWSLVAKWFLAPLAITTGAWILCGWRPGLPARDAEVGPMLRFAFNTFGNFIMNYIRRNIDKILIGRYYGSRSLGFYDRAYHLSGILSHQLIFPVYNVAVSAFSRLTDDHEKYRRNFLKVLEILSFVGMPLSAVLSLVSHDLILLILGSKWENAAPVFFAFSLSVGVSIVYLAHGWLHLSLGTPDRWFRWGIIELIVTIIFIVIGLPYGGLGVACAYSSSIYVIIGPAFWYAGKPVNLKIYSIFSSLWKYYVAALVAGLSCYYLLHIYDNVSVVFNNFNIIFRIAAAAILCIIIYLMLIITLYRSVSPISQFVSILKDTVSNKNLSK